MATVFLLTEVEQSLVFVDNESQNEPIWTEGVSVNHWRLTVYHRTSRGGLGSPAEQVQRRSLNPQSAFLEAA
jgi:hypothetical protein